MTLSPEGLITFICGEKESGKTSRCLQIASEALGAGHRVSGIVCEHIYENGQRIAITAKNLGDGENRTLARRPEASREAATIQTAHWGFDESVLAWGNEVFGRAVPTDVLIVDEIGILEFERNQGWLLAIQALESGKYSRAFVSLRPSLVSLVKKRWPTANWISL